MKASDVFVRSREAALRIRAIEAEKRELMDRIGVQGHTYGAHAKNGILDPMRKVDDMIDSTADLDDEISECMKDVDEAWSLIRGIYALCPYDDAGLLVTRRYVRAETIADISATTTYPKSIVSKALEQILAWCDEVGIARLKSAVDYE